MFKFKGNSTLFGRKINAEIELEMQKSKEKDLPELRDRDSENLRDHNTEELQNSNSEDLENNRATKILGVNVINMPGVGEVVLNDIDLEADVPQTSPSPEQRSSCCERCLIM